MANRIFSVKGIPCLYCYQYKDGRLRYFVKIQLHNRIITKNIEVKTRIRHNELKCIAIQTVRILKNSFNNSEELKHWIDEYIVVRQLKPKTAKAYRKILEGYSLDPHHNAIHLAQMISININTCQIIRTVKAFFNWLNQNGLAIQNPAANVRIPRVKPRQRTLTDSEIVIYYQELSKCHIEIQLFGRLLLETGARVSSIYAIRINDLSSDGLFLHNIKSGRDYSLRIPLSKPTLALWNTWVSQRAESDTVSDAPLFCSKFNTLCRQLRFIFDSNFNTSSNGERVVIHTLRHTAATLALQNGVPMELVCCMLDHSNIQTTMSTYAKTGQTQFSHAFECLFMALQLVH